MLNIKFRDVGNTEFIPHQFKPIIGGIISAVGSIAGGAISKAGSVAAARASLQATRETNAANLKLAQYQNDWNIAQWNRQNAYNSPLAQRQRFEEAGINPYFALGNINSGSAQSLQSADMANQQNNTEAFNIRAAGAQQLGASVAAASSQFLNAAYLEASAVCFSVQCCCAF